MGTKCVDLPKRVKLQSDQILFMIYPGRLLDFCPRPNIRTCCGSQLIMSMMRAKRLQLHRVNHLLKLLLFQVSFCFQFHSTPVHCARNQVTHDFILVWFLFTWSLFSCFLFLVSENQDGTITLEIFKTQRRC